MSTDLSTGAADYDLEPAIYALAGAASIAALVLDAIREDDNRASSESLKEGLSWLEGQLYSGAEHLLAIHESRPTKWRTLSEVETIQDALMRAEKRGEARLAKRCASALPPKAAA